VIILAVIGRLEAAPHVASRIRNTKILTGKNPAWHNDCAYHENKIETPRKSTSNELFRFYFVKATLLFGTING